VPRANYPQDYIKACFDAWYLNGRPTTPSGIKRIIPISPNGKAPSTATINRWVVNGMWDIIADEMDVKALSIVDDGLINKKAQMLLRHQEDAIKLANKAHDYLLKEGFDSASAAVQAYFKATEEQRKTAGFSDLLERMEKMSNNEVERLIVEKFNRIKENDQIIEIESEDIGEENETED
jgi:hypothetical protein